MNNSDHEHESLRAYLAGEDEREKANRAAEQAKQFIKRKCAMKYGDSGSPVEPISFSPVSCKTCDDILDHNNRSDVQGTCQQCLKDQAARRSMVIAAESREAYAKAAKESAAASFWPAALLVSALIIVGTACAILLGIAVGWGADKVCYWIGWTL